MIFKRFFKANWQHKDANVRVQAIEQELNLLETSDRDIVLTLLANDESELVRRAALIKLNDLHICLDVIGNNTMAKIRQFAQNLIENQLTQANNNKISDTVKQSLIQDERLTKTILEKWLKAEQSPEIVIALFHQIAKPHLLHSVFKHHQNEAIQLALLHDEISSEVLEKLAKSACNDTVQNRISELLEQLATVKALPGQIEKEAQLLLSKLLVLREERNYGKFLKLHQSYVQQWQEIVEKLSCLPETLQQTFIEKFDDISLQIERAQAPQAEAYQQQQIVEALEAKRTAQLNAITIGIEHLKEQLQAVIFDESTEQMAVLTDNAAALLHNIETSELGEATKKTIRQQVNDITSKLENIEQIINANANAMQLIAAFAQKNLPESQQDYESASEAFFQWHRQWQQCRQQAQGFLPSSLSSAHQEIEQRWRHGLKPFKQQQEKYFKDAERKLNDTKRLINQGKFNAAFGVFKGAQQDFDRLSQKQQYKLAKLYQMLSEKLHELNDWEHYVSTPKKQSLLSEVEQLVKHPLDNPKQQADKVKAYRQQWNALGHAEDELESELNKKFNESCELAFLPCRQFFAEQEAIRQRNATAREQLTQQAQALAAQTDIDNLDVNKLAKALKTLEQSWRQAGDVDRERYQALNKDFKMALSPLHKALKDTQQQNYSLKESLITKASALLSLDDVNEATHKSILLQREWKTIGFCGHKAENNLWQQFRHINDEVFAKKTVLQQELAGNIAALNKQYQQDLTEIMKNYDPQSLSSLKSTKVALTQLTNNIAQQPIALENINQTIQKNLDSLAKQQAILETDKKREQWGKLFTLLRHIAEGKSIDEQLVSLLPKVWQKHVNACVAKQQPDQSARLEKTIAIEIVAELPTPALNMEKRLAIQVGLMQEQMTSHKKLTTEALLIEWLSLGNISEQDAPLIDRIKPAFQA